MRINQNVMAFNASRNLSSTNVQLGKSLEKLSSGFRINRAGDDAAGLVISQGLRAQISGLRQATRNAQDGISVVQTAEGALNEVHTMLNRMRDLSVQASNTGSTDAEAAKAIQAEINQLVLEVDRVAEKTSFGTMSLLDGGYGVSPAVMTSAAPVAGNSFDLNGAGASSVTLNVANTVNVTVVVDSISGTAAEVAADLTKALNDGLASAGSIYAGKVSVEGEFDGTNSTFTVKVGGLKSGENFTLTNGTDTPLNDLGLTAAAAAASGDGGVFQVGANAADTISVNITSVTTASLSLDAIDVTSFSGAQAAITALDSAIETVSKTRGDLGAIQNRFESTINNLSVTTENLAASESRIRDTDMAAEMVAFTRNQVLQQAGTAMLAQANQVPQTILQLLR